MGKKLKALIPVIPSLVAAYLAFAYLYSYKVLLYPKEIYLFGGMSERTISFLVGAVLILILQVVYMILFVRYRKSIETVNVLVSANFVVTVALLYWVISSYAVLVTLVLQEILIPPS